MSIKFPLIVCSLVVLAASNLTTVANAMEMPMDGNQMPMLEPKADDSFADKFAAIPAEGWTVSASDQNASNPAGYAIDGNPDTFWHSAYEPDDLPLPHSLTIDMHAAKNVSGLVYVPRQDGEVNGNIGRYTITTSQNGTSWSAPVATGTFDDDQTTKTVIFPSVSVGFVKLTALTEAGGRGVWSSAAELQLIGNPPADPALPRSGWTVAASDEANENTANNVLDGNADTIWHSAYDPNDVPLPHTLTIDMQVARPVTGITYLPRQDGVGNGTIGNYAVSVSTDGTNFNQVATGTWADDETAKTATFASVSARYVRLTALSEAGNRGVWSSAAELNVLSPGPSVGVGGSWSAPIGLPLVPVSAVALPNNKLLTFAAYSGVDFDYTSVITKVSIIDLAQNTVGQEATVDTQHEMFCTGLAIMADGRVLINGGSSDSATTIYNPNNNTWTKGPLMKIPRAYQGTTTLSNGKVFTLGGSWYDTAESKNGEIFTPSGTTGSWSKLTGVTVNNILTADPAGVYRADNHAWLFATANGGVFHAGPSKQMNWITTSGTGSITSAGNRADSDDAMNGNAVMYDVGKILTVGGSTAYADVDPGAYNTQATRRAYVLDITGGSSKPVKTTRVSDMMYPRAFNNAVVLPDGQVLVLGGQQHPEPFTDTGAVLSPELWNPVTGAFTVMSADVIPRTYHSVALLLPDGRVFSGGGGLCGECTTNHSDGRIFTPPYLLNADGTLRTRPVITAAPATAAPGSTISVTTNASGMKFALVRTSAVTHSVNTDQRRIPLTVASTSGNTAKLNIPSNRGTVLPGTYMLFALKADGTPSVAKFITIN